jgi:hypothetical protein
MGTVFLARSQTTGQRFAVKKTKLRDEKSRRNFLTELQTWLDLPEHPHLTACRFFRTVADEVLVFAEYVDGGSLHDWIRHRKLQDLEQILDVAIQFAWGLHAAHEAGLVHQDVKPGNVLLTADGLVKVTDFGLARARGLAGEGPVQPGQSILISCGGMTPAYCSPEQAAGQPLSRKTDVWSWGVSLLEMFTGGVSWKSGTVAPRVLEGLLKSGPEDDLPAMPDAVAEILRKCFHQSPGERWANLEEAAQRLQTVYGCEIGRAHPRQRPTSGVLEGRAEAEHHRPMVKGITWTDPRAYLREALQESGQDPQDAEAVLPPRGSSRRGQAIADLAVYDEAWRLFQRLIEGGRKDLENRLATLCHDKALVHEHVDDMPGAVALYDQGIALRERLVHSEGRRELAHDLARVYMAKALAVRVLGDNRAAVGLHDQAIAIQERLVNVEGRRELANDLANVYLNKALAVSALGDSQAALRLYDQAIAIRERLVHHEGRHELQGDLAWVRLYRAELLLASGDRSQAQVEARAALPVLQTEIERTGRADLQGVLKWVTSKLREVLEPS